MAKKFLLFSVFLLVGVAAVIVSAVDCPSAAKVVSCTPKCVQDSECSRLGGRCCPNLCNGRSCADPNLLGSSGSKSNSKYSGSSNGYCGNQKCSPYEKCGTDRITKRPKCVRT